jgi:hypothetical protein
MVPTIVMSIKEILEELPKLTPEEKRQLWKVSLEAYADPLMVCQVTGLHSWSYPDTGGAIAGRLTSKFNSVPSGSRTLTISVSVSKAIRKLTARSIRSFHAAKKEKTVRENGQLFP